MTRTSVLLGAIAFCRLASLSPATFANDSVHAQAKPASTAPSQLEDLAGLAGGAIVVQGAKAPSAMAEAWYMLDDPTTGWTSEAGAHVQPDGDRARGSERDSRRAFDTASIETDGREPKEVLVEMSDTSATDGFKPLVQATLTVAPKDGQRFKATADIPGRWLRITVKSMQQATHDVVSIMEFRALVIA